MKKKAIFIGLLGVLFMMNIASLFAQDAGVFDYICVYNKNESGFFLDNKPMKFLNTEGFSRDKKSYSYKTKDSEVVINAYLTWSAILDTKNKYDVQINGKKKEKSYALNTGANTFTITVLNGTTLLSTYTVNLERTSSAPTPPPAPPGPVLSGVSVSAAQPSGGQPASGTFYIDIRTETQRVDSEKANFEIQWKAWKSGMNADNLRSAESAADDATWKPLTRAAQYGSQANPGIRYSLTKNPFSGEGGYGTDSVIVRGRQKNAKGWGPWVYFLGGNNDKALP